MIIAHGFLQTLFVAAFTGIIFIVVFNLIDKPMWLDNLLSYLSKHSTNMWLVHMFFYMIFFKDLVYAPKYSTSISTFKSKAGLFTQDKYIPVIEGIINLVSSIILLKYFGLVGVFMGTTISTVTIQLWNRPRIVYKELFNIQLIEYFKKYIYYVLITLIVGAITTFLCNNFVYGSGFLSLVLKGLICVIVPNLIYISLFYKTEEFNYLLDVLKPYFNKFNTAKLKIKIED